MGLFYFNENNQTNIGLLLKIYYEFKIIPVYQFVLLLYLKIYKKYSISLIWFNIHSLRIYTWVVIIWKNYDFFVEND
jgi:hypothetical protein